MTYLFVRFGKYKQDKNLVIYNSPALVTSPYFKGDLQSTLHHLEKSLMNYDKRNNNHFGNEKIERSLRQFAELDIKTDEAQEDAAKELQRLENIQIILMQLVETTSLHREARKLSLKGFDVHQKSIRNIAA